MSLSKNTDLLFLTRVVVQQFLTFRGSYNYKNHLILSFERTLGGTHMPNSATSLDMFQYYARTFARQLDHSSIGLNRQITVLQNSIHGRKDLFPHGRFDYWDMSEKLLLLITPSSHSQKLPKLQNSFPTSEPQRKTFILRGQKLIKNYQFFSSNWPPIVQECQKNQISRNNLILLLRFFPIDRFHSFHRGLSWKCFKCSGAW